MFFTFWALPVLKKATHFKGKPFTDKLMGMMLPGGPERLSTSKMNMCGMGPKFFEHVMAKKNIASLSDLMTMARECGVRIVACQMAMDVMGITQDEMRDDLEYGGVATYLADAGDSKITLFI